jgi:DNA-binding transcriptional regulator LsrR (DeoR family)
MSTELLRRTGVEQLLQNLSRPSLVRLLQDANIYGIIEVSRQDDISRLYEVIKFLPDDPEVSYIIPILMIRD